MCVQYNSIINQVRGQEDCLYLNVYTPQVIQINLFNYYSKLERHYNLI